MNQVYAQLLLSALSWSCVIALLPGPRQLNGRLRIIVFLCAFVVALVPIGGLPLVGYPRGITGDFSILTQLLLLTGLVCQITGRQLMGEQQRYRFTLAIAIISLTFYPLTLGLTHYSPYDQAFDKPWLLLSVILIAGICWFLKYFLSTVMLSLCVLAYSLRLLESENLWDYLIDPLLGVYCVIWTFKKTLHRARNAPEAPD